MIEDPISKIGDETDDTLEPSFSEAKAQKDEDSFDYDTFAKNQTTYSAPQPAPYGRIGRRPSDPIIPEEQELPSVLDTFSATYRDQDALYNAYNSLTYPNANGQNPLTLEQIIERVPNDLIPYADTFLDKTSQQAIDKHINDMQSYLQDKEVLEQRPWVAFGASILEGFNPTNPINWLPLGQVYNAFKGSESVGKAAIATGAAATVGAAANEALLHQFQEARTVEESMYNTVASGLIGGILGAGVHVASKYKSSLEVSKIYKDNAEIKNVKFAEKNPETGEFSAAEIKENLENDTVLSDEKSLDDSYLDDFDDTKSAGAAETDVISKLQAEIEGEKPEALLGRLFAKITVNPFLQTMDSPFASVRKMGAHVFENTVKRKKNVSETNPEANSQSLEIAIKNSIGNAEASMADIDKIFLEQAGISPDKKFGMTKEFLQRKLSDSPGLDKDTFYRQVTEAIWNKSDNEFINRAADLYYDRVIKPFSDDLIKYGFMQESEFPVAERYAPTFYNTPAIELRPEAFDLINFEWFKEVNAELKSLEPTHKVIENELSSAKKALKEFKRRELELGNIEKRLTKKISKAKKAELTKQRDLLRNKIGENTYEDAISKIESAQKKYNDIPRKYKNSKGELRLYEPDEFVLKTQAQQVRHTIVDGFLGSLTNDFGASSRNPVKHLTHLIPRDRITDFVMTDIRDVHRMYTGKVIPSIEAAKTAERLGINTVKEAEINRLFKSLEEEKERYSAKKDLSDAEVEEYQRMAFEKELQILELKSPAGAKDLTKFFESEIIAESEQLIKSIKAKPDSVLSKAKKEAQEKSVLKARDASIKLVDASIDMTIAGYRSSKYVNDTVQEGSRLLKNIAVMLRMGMATMSSVADVAQQVFKFGPGRTIKQFSTALHRGLKGEKSGNYNSLRRLGFAINKETSRHARRFSDLDNTYQTKSKIGKVADAGSEAMFTLNAMNWWNDYMQTMAGDMSTSQTLEAIHSFVTTGKMPKKEQGRLLKLGIGKEHWKEIYKQWEAAGGIDKKGNMWLDTTEMDLSTPKAAEAFDVYNQALRRDISGTAIEKGKGDVPFVMNDPVVSNLMQFKSFAMAAYNKALVANLSDSDAHIFAGTVTALMLGSASYVVTGILRDGGDTLDLSVENLISEGIDRGTLLPIIWGSKNLLQKAMGLQTNTRYNSRSIAGAFAGPSIGAVSDVLEGTGKIIRSQMPTSSPMYHPILDKDAKLFLRMIPFQNLFYLMYLNRKVAGATARALGATKTGQI